MKLLQELADNLFEELSIKQRALKLQQEIQDEVDMDGHVMLKPISSRQLTMLMTLGSDIEVNAKLETDPNEHVFTQVMCKSLAGKFPHLYLTSHDDDIVSDLKALELFYKRLETVLKLFPRLKVKYEHDQYQGQVKVDDWREASDMLTNCGAFTQNDVGEANSEQIRFNLWLKRGESPGERQDGFGLWVTCTSSNKVYIFHAQF